MNHNLNSYELSRRWFDFAFDNPEKVSPNHVAIYFFAIEHCNRLGWKTKFGFPTQMAMDALGIKKHQTYIRYFNDLVDWNFFNLIQKSQNQYSANIISLVSDMPKNGKALDKAIITHAANQTETNGQSNGQSNSSIDKQVNNITIKDCLVLPKGENALYFYIAKSFHNTFYNYKGSKSLENAIVSDWTKVIRLLIENDKVPVTHLIAIKMFLQAGIDKEKGVDTFWSDTIYSISALRKKSKDGVYQIDRIIQATKKWLDRNPEREAMVYEAETELNAKING